MHQEDLKSLFDQQAPTYDKQWARMAPMRDCLHFLVASFFADLPADARILCVGVGTGLEIAHLARTFPGWRFTAIDPSGAMLDACRTRAEVEGFGTRCDYHQGYLETLPAKELHDGATCFLVSQFIVEERDRTQFFRAIADRLKPGGLLASADLASYVGSNDYEWLLRAWIGMMSAAAVPQEAIARARAAYAKDVAILPPERIANIIESAGFEQSVQFFQAGLMHAWISKRA